MMVTEPGYVPQFASATRESGAGVGARVWAAWVALVIGAGAVVGMVVSAPLALAGGEQFWSRAVYGAFRGLCHQSAERSFHLAGHPLAVCARCFGIYAGFAAGALAYPALRSLRLTHAPARAWLFASAVPVALDFLLGVLGVWSNTHLSRALTGGLLGACVPFYVVPALVQIATAARRRKFFDVPSGGREGAT